MRLKQNQEKHDIEVLRLAQDAINKGWKIVYADLPNLQKPPIINGYIPDIYAHNGWEELVIEVETQDTNLSHSISQHVAFRKWANEKLASRKFLTFIA